MPSLPCDGPALSLPPLLLRWARQWARSCSMRESLATMPRPGFGDEPVLLSESAVTLMAHTAEALLLACVRQCTAEERSWTSPPQSAAESVSRCGIATAASSPAIGPAPPALVRLRHWFRAHGMDELGSWLCQEMQTTPTHGEPPHLPMLPCIEGVSAETVLLLFRCVECLLAELLQEAAGSADPVYVPRARELQLAAKQRAARHPDNEEAVPDADCKQVDSSSHPHENENDDEDEEDEPHADLWLVSAESLRGAVRMDPQLAALLCMLGADVAHRWGDLTAADCHGPDCDSAQSSALERSHQAASTLVAQEQQEAESQSDVGTIDSICSDVLFTLLDPLECEDERLDSERQKAAKAQLELAVLRRPLLVAAQEARAQAQLAETHKPVTEHVRSFPDILATLESDHAATLGPAREQMLREAGVWWLNDDKIRQYLPTGKTSADRLTVATSSPAAAAASSDSSCSSSSSSSSVSGSESGCGGGSLEVGHPLFRALHIRPLQWYGCRVRSLARGRVTVSALDNGNDDAHRLRSSSSDERWEALSFSLVDADGREFPLLLERCGGNADSNQHDCGYIYTARQHPDCASGVVPDGSSSEQQPLQQADVCVGRLRSGYDCTLVHMDMPALRRALPGFAQSYRAHGALEPGTLGAWLRYQSPHTHCAAYTLDDGNGLSTISRRREMMEAVGTRRSIKDRLHSTETHQQMLQSVPEQQPSYRKWCALFRAQVDALTASQRLQLEIEEMVAAAATFLPRLPLHLFADNQPRDLRLRHTIHALKRRGTAVSASTSTGSASESEEWPWLHRVWGDPCERPLPDVLLRLIAEYTVEPLLELPWIADEERLLLAASGEKLAAVRARCSALILGVSSEDGCAGHYDDSM